MANIFKIDVRQEDVVIKWLGSLPMIVNRRMVEGLQRGGKILVDTAKQISVEEGAVGATKGYSQGWRFSIEPTRQDRRVGFLYNEARHAFWAEHGRRANKPMPPKGALLEWMALRGIPQDREFIIRRAIGRRGTIKRKSYGGYEILDKTNQRARADVFEEFDLALNRAIRDMA